ncbi:MAG: Wzz/FepE/Etk N-terminal domain-containing protein [candidate division KSB1 bacterium]|nr:Wzz/FepE/Etk N-terminal domain-containing protein [candidate division KSB1 bacterium]MDZ7294772.1 Wzz/FepE/Etk N-terminal domain-containing protein [candidate division KSB1 bacterium]
MAPQRPRRDEEGDGQFRSSSLFDYLYVLFKRRRFILLTVLTVAVVTALVSLFLPNWYAARASLLPPKRPGGIAGMLEGGLSSLMKNLSGLGRGLGGSEEAYSYLAILQSRTAMEAVVQKFDLVKVYKIKDGSVEKAVRKLSRNAEFDIGSEGNINITVYDRDRQRAADMANYFIEVLNEISVRLGTQEARNNREFVEKRYHENLRDLRLAEDSLKAFQQRYGIYALSEQTEAAIKGAAELKGEVTAKEIALRIAERSLGTDNPETQALRLQVAEMNRKLREMKFGTDDWFSGRSLNLFVPFKDVPELGMEYIRRYREFEIQNKLMEFLLPLYEQAKLEEQKEMPVVLVLDRAVPPERKAKPRRSLLVIIFTALAALFATSAAFVAEIYEREKEHNPRVAALAEAIPGRRAYQHVVRSVKRFPLLQGKHRG